MSWENILKDDGVVEDFNEIMDSLMKATKLTKKYMTFNSAFDRANHLIVKAGKILNSIDEDEMNDLFNPDKAIRVADDAKEVPSRQYISSRGFEDRR
jgi:hypothetical protein